jgi:hypothetical protein
MNEIFVVAYLKRKISLFVRDDRKTDCRLLALNSERSENPFFEYEICNLRF